MRACMASCTCVRCVAPPPSAWLSVAVCSVFCVLPLGVCAPQVPPLLTLLCTINGTAACGPDRSSGVGTGAMAEAVSHLQQATWLQASYDAAHIQYVGRRRSGDWVSTPHNV